MENKYRSFNDLPLTLCVEDLMPILGIGRNTAYELVRSGQIIFNRPCYTRCMNGYSLQYCGKEDLQL